MSAGCVWVVGAAVVACGAESSPGKAAPLGSGGSTSTTGAGAGTTSSTAETTTSTTSTTTSTTTMAAGDTLDPAEVYLAGTVAEGSCGRDALAHWSTPNKAAAGFDCYFDERTAKVRPTDGRLLYVNTFEDVLREFHCDSCPFEPTGGFYPNGVLDNDPVIPTAPCDSTQTSKHLSAFLVSPGGSILHQCYDDNRTWYDGAGAVAYTDANGADPLLHLGHGSLALTKNNVRDLSSGTATPIIGLPVQSVIFVRAVAPDAFLLLLEPAIGSADPDANELWKVDATGAATLVGTYPALPPAAKQADSYSAVLDPNGVLFEFGEGQVTFEDIIIRRTIGGTSDVVYDEATDPLVKIHISALVTGP